MINDIASELAKLHELTGAEFSRQVERIANMHLFHPTNGEDLIYGIGGKKGMDYLNQLKAARKLVVLGYKVFLLPNPRIARTPDLIVERKGIYRIYDLKTITGESSAITTNYDSRIEDMSLVDSLHSFLVFFSLYRQKSASYFLPCNLPILVAGAGIEPATS